MAKRTWWILNAARRTLTTALPSLAPLDDAWAATQLKPAEYDLFLRLPPSERGHGVEVAKRVLRSRPHASSALVRAALLHDVGKLGFDSSVLERVGAHLLPAADVPPEPRLTGLVGARQARIHHPAYGEALVMATSGDERVADLVRRHHEPGSDEEARILHDCDELT
jgi:hypothetical protein